MINRIKLLKFIDKTIGGILVSLLPIIYFRPKINASKINKILFIRPGGIGDAVLLIPSIILLKNQYPEAVIDVLAEKRNSEIYSLCAEVNTVYRYDRPKELLHVIRKSYDVVIDTEQWHRLSAVIARLGRAPMSIGFSTNERGKLFTHPIPYSHDEHEVYSFINLLSPIVREKVKVPTPFISLPPEVLARMNDYLLPLSGKKLVAIFPGGSVKQKQWPSDMFHDMITLLVQQGYGMVVIGGREDMSEAAKIVGDISSVVNLCGKLSLVETAAVLKKTVLLVSGDSGIMHIASALGTRVLALFGPSNVIKWAPFSEHSHVILNKLDCSPCSRFGYMPRCRHHVACMNHITVDEVFSNAIRLLET